VQAATNGIEFAKSKEFCKKAFEAGMRYAYLQFDGIGNDANSHRQVGNLFDVKLRAIENMHEAGIEIVLVTTIVNNVNNDQVGPIVKFAMENPKKIASCPSSRFPSPGATRKSLRNAASASATRFRTGKGRQLASGQSRADARLVPDFLHQHFSRASRIWYTDPTRSGARSPAAATPNCGVGTA
jgi:molybdenum cofactor biosynthesis enzyme MoaA